MLRAMSDAKTENLDGNLYEQLLATFRAGAKGRPPRPSAAIVPWRRGPAGGLEVYWVERAPTLRFMGGWHAFPGGGLSRSDAAIAIAGEAAGGSTTASSRAQGESPGDTELPPDIVPGLLVCALRELFEETGLVPTTGASPTRDTLDRWREGRRRLLAGETGFDELVETLRPSARDLVFAGRWLTPPLAPMRFDNRFFLLEWPAERTLQPEIIPGELVAGEWIAPTVALDRWRAGEVIAAPPILHLLRVLAEDGPAAGLGRLRDPDETFLGPIRRIEFRPGVILLPLLTPTLPPATHTNAFLLGGDEAVLVDPATPIPSEQDRLSRAVADFQARGKKVVAIWLTHHHHDHVGAVERMRRELGVPVLAHRASATPLERLGIPLDGWLEDGDRHTLAGDPPLRVRVCHTPGHSRGHLCFFDEDRGSLIAGDLVSSLSTIVVDPPEGDMDAYLDSLRAMAELAPTTLFPAHGPPIIEAVGKLEEFHHHRLEREAQVLAAWQRGRRSAGEMVAEVYADVPTEVHPIARRQIEAHLVRLRRLGQLD